jgi:transcriptional regulator with XRE-family HTH domain
MTYPPPAGLVRRRFQQRRASKEPRIEAETLRQIRKLRRRSQSDVAATLGTVQSEVSKLESRLDLRVSTLTAYVQALGGSLEMNARFPGLLIRIKLGK